MVTLSCFSFTTKLFFFCYGNVKLHPQVIISKISENFSALAEYSSLDLLSTVSIKVHASPSTPSPLVYLQDSLSSSKFLVDSGASILVFPALPSTSRSGVSLRVLSADSPTSTSIILPASQDPTAAHLRAKLLATLNCISNLLSEFPDVVSSDGFTASKPCHRVSHLLLTQSGPPVFTKTSPLNPETIASTKAEFSAIWLR